MGTSQVERAGVGGWEEGGIELGGLGRGEGRTG
jgi:hypothetical protein